MNGEARSGTRMIAAHFCAAMVAAFFLYAAWGKIGPKNTRQFAVQIKNYRILDAAHVNLPAILLPWCEVAAALALLAPRTRRAGAILIAMMLLVFIAAVAYSALYKGLVISCGCTGEGSARAGWTTIARNVGLLAATGVSVWLLPGRGKKAAVAFGE